MADNNSVLSKLSQKRVMDEQNKKGKEVGRNKLRSYQAKNSSTVASMFSDEIRSEEVKENKVGVTNSVNADGTITSRNSLGIDPYSKTRSSGNKAAEKLRTANSGYQSILLEKILQSTNNPEQLSNTLKYQSTVVDYLKDFKEILTKISSPRIAKSISMEEAAYKRETGTLAKNLAELNISGLLKDTRKSIVGASGLGSSPLGQLIEGLNSVRSMFGPEMIKAGIKSGVKNTALTAAFGKNKVFVDMFEKDPVNMFQTLINLGGNSKNSAIRKMMNPHYVGQNMAPNIKRNIKDPKGIANFDNKAHTALTQVIPDMLAKLVANAENSERMKYNYKEGKYETISQIYSADRRSTKSKADFQDKTINNIRDYIELADKQRGSTVGKSMVKLNGKAARNSQSKIILKDDQLFMNVLTAFTNSGGDLLELSSGDTSSLIRRYNLDRMVDEESRPLLPGVVDLIRQALLGMTTKALVDANTSYIEEKKELMNIVTSDNMADITKYEMSLLNQMHSGSITYDEFVKRVSSNGAIASFVTSATSAAGSSSTIRKPSNTWKNGSGAFRRSTRRATTMENASSNNKSDLASSFGRLGEATLTATRERNARLSDPERHKFSNIQEKLNNLETTTTGRAKSKEESRVGELLRLKDYGLISDKDISDYAESKGGNSSTNAKIEKQTAKLTTASVFFSKLVNSNQTADAMARLSGEPTSRWIARGYFSNVSEVLEYVGDNGVLNYEAIQARNTQFTARYFADIDKRIVKQQSNTFAFDVKNPMNTVDEVATDLFKDPALVRKLGIGAGTATGIALGKLINNKTFIKSPNAGYLLGALGAAVMNMERTQSYLNQTLGPGGGVGNGGISNRQIFMAKLLGKWLPAAGLGGKAAGMTMGIMSKLGPVGKLLGPLGGLLVGGTVAAATPSLMRFAKRTLFDDDGKGNQTTFKKLGNVLRQVPGVNELFVPNDNREDGLVLRDSVRLTIDKVDRRIAELNADPDKSKGEEAELNNLIEYRKKLDVMHGALVDVSKIRDKSKRTEEYGKYKESAMNNKEVEATYNEEKKKQASKTGDIADMKFSIRNTDKEASSYASAELKRDEKEGHLDSSTRDMYTKIAGKKGIFSGERSGGSIKDLINTATEDYIKSKNIDIRMVAQRLKEGDHLSSDIGTSKVRGYEDSDGNFVPGLNNVTSKKEFDTWYGTLDTNDRGKLKEYTNSKTAMSGLRDHLRKLVAFQVDSTNPNLSPIERTEYIENTINQELRKSKHLKGVMSNMFGEAKMNVSNKANYMMGIGGTRDEHVLEDNLALEKIMSYMDGGKGVDTTRSVKMRELSSYRLGNGTKLSIAGCSIAALNNALVMLNKGGIAIESLIASANKYLTPDGGVTTEFMREIATNIGINCKTYNSMDNRWSNELLFKFKPTSTSAIILLIKNSNGVGNHFVNVKSMTAAKAVIDDPEINGLVDVSLSTLVNSLIEVVVLDSSGSASKSNTSSDNTSSIRPTGKTASGLPDYVGNVIDKYGSISALKKTAGSYIGSKANNVIDNVPMLKSLFGMRSDAMTGAGGMGNKSDNTVNVRIVEDLTLPLTMNDSKAAAGLSRDMMSAALAPGVKRSIRSMMNLRKNPALSKEMHEAQKVQENTQIMADALSGNSSGIGGKGSMGSGLAEKADKGLLAALFGLFGIAAGKKATSAFDAMKKWWDSRSGTKVKPTFDENGNVLSAGSSPDTSGWFSKATEELYATGGIVRGGWEAGKIATKGVVSKASSIVKSAGGKLKSGIGKIFKSSSKLSKAGKAASKVDDVVDATKVMAKQASAISKIGVLFSGLGTRIVSALGKVGEAVKAVFMPVLKLVGSSKVKGGGFLQAVETLFNGIGKKLGPKIVKLLSSILGKTGRLIKKLPFISKAITSFQAIFSVKDGYENADVYLRLPDDEVTTMQRCKCSALKFLYDGIGVLIYLATLAIILVVATLTGGTAAGLVMVVPHITDYAICSIRDYYILDFRHLLLLLDIAKVDRLDYKDTIGGRTRITEEEYKERSAKDTAELNVIVAKETKVDAGLKKLADSRHSPTNTSGLGMNKLAEAGIKPKGYVYNPDTKGGNGAISATVAAAIVENSLSASDAVAMRHIPNGLLPPHSKKHYDDRNILYITGVDFAKLHKDVLALQKIPSGALRKKAYFKALFPLASRIESMIKLPAQLMILQSAKETAWGRTYRASTGWNLYGIKWTSGCGFDQVRFTTHEVLNGVNTKMKDKFRAYDGGAESMLDFARLVTSGRPYVAAWNRYLADIAKNGITSGALNRFVTSFGKTYATDPAYAISLMTMLERDTNNIRKLSNDPVSKPASSKANTTAAIPPSAQVDGLKSNHIGGTISKESMKSVAPKGYNKPSSANKHTISTSLGGGKFGPPNSSDIRLNPVLVAPGDGQGITSAYGPRTYTNELRQVITSNHKGIDFRSPVGNPVSAAHDGIFSIRNFVGYVTGVDNNGDKLETEYRHCDSLDKSLDGKMVSAGDVIGRSGTRGANHRPHLHFGVKKNGVNVDPMTDFFKWDKSAFIPSKVKDSENAAWLSRVKSAAAKSNNDTPITTNAEKGGPEEKVNYTPTMTDKGVIQKWEVGGSRNPANTTVNNSNTFNTSQNDDGVNKKLLRVNVEILKLLTSIADRNGDYDGMSR